MRSIEKTHVPESAKEAFEVVLRDSKRLRVDKGGDENSRSVQLLNPDGSTLLDFASWLPEHCIFVAEQRFNIHPVGGFGSAIRREVWVPRFNDPREITSLLHEIGHAHTLSSTDKFSLSSPKNLLKRTRRKLEIESQQERLATAWELWAIRTLKKDFDVDVVAEFGGWEEFQSFLHSGKRALGNYEKNRIDEAGMEELRGLFSKKYYHYKEGEKREEQPEETA